MIETFSTKQSSTLALRGSDGEQGSISQTLSIMVHVGRVS